LFRGVCEGWGVVKKKLWRAQGCLLRQWGVGNGQWEEEEGEAEGMGVRGFSAGRQGRGEDAGGECA
jgi:hypothetical protein